MDEQAPVVTVDRLVAGPVPWPNLPASAGARSRVLVARALTGKCPYCGGKGIFANFFTLKPICPHCEVQFEREDGYFLGGYALNMVFSEFVALGLAVYLIFFTPLRDLSLLPQEIIAASLAIGIPLLFFPLSRTLWMALDLTLHPPEPNTNGARDFRRS